MTRGAQQFQLSILLKTQLYMENFNAQNLMQIKSLFAHLKHSNLYSG